jgi:hypothetical protein
MDASGAPGLAIGRSRPILGQIEPICGERAVDESDIFANSN